MAKLLNVSSSPHVRSKLTTREIMIQVLLALLPVTFIGIFEYGKEALFVILAAVISSVVTEALFNIVMKKKQTISDCSAAVTGLMLALTLPPRLPLYVPVLGGVFAILIVKCLFGGLGRNFMNPALAARCFLLISYGSVVTIYTLDGVATATPLAEYAAGNAVDLAAMFWGKSSGVIGSSVLGILVGALLLMAWDVIAYEIPTAMLLSFTAFMAIFGGHGLDLHYLLVQVMGGGILFGAFFMATDYVTSPVTFRGRLIYGAAIGIWCGLFRILGNSADSVSYAIIIGNMLVPLIEEYTIPTAYGHRKQKEESDKLGKADLKPALILCAITLIAGALLSGVYEMTKDTIAEQQLAKETESYQLVCPDAEEFVFVEEYNAAVEALNGEIYGDGLYGKAYIQQVIAGIDASGQTVGYVISAATGDGYDGTIAMSVGIDIDGTVTGIEFTEINESAGMGMLCAEPEFKDQFSGKKVDSFVLNKAGGSANPEEIDSVSGASKSSGAIVNAVNAALGFYAEYMR